MYLERIQVLVVLHLSFMLDLLDEARPNTNDPIKGSKKSGDNNYIGEL